MADELLLVVPWFNGHEIRLLRTDWWMPYCLECDYQTAGVEGCVFEQAAAAVAFAADLVASQREAEVSDLRTQLQAAGELAIKRENSARQLHAQLLELAAQASSKTLMLHERDAQIARLAEALAAVLGVVKRLEGETNLYASMSMAHLLEWVATQAAELRAIVLRGRLS